MLEGLRQRRKTVGLKQTMKAVEADRYRLFMSQRMQKNG